MSEKRPLILVTNDDGYSSKGISELVKMARELGDVVVVAPDSVQSGKSNAITVEGFVRLNLRKSEPGLTVYSVTGTPVDCVKMALNQILERKPDLLLSGINHGTNSSVSIAYSGTLGAAIEGALNGIPSAGVSLCSYDADADFSVAVKCAGQVARKILQAGNAGGICLNVNIPYVPESEFKGMKMCRQSKGIWKEHFVVNNDPHGHPYYWLTGGFVNHEPEALDTDEWALTNGYASIVPVNLDFTAYSQFEKLAYLI